MDDLFFDLGEMRVEVEEEAYLLTQVKQLKDFSVQIGRISHVLGDVDLNAYKKKAREMMEAAACLHLGRTAAARNSSGVWQGSRVGGCSAPLLCQALVFSPREAYAADM